MLSFPLIFGSRWRFCRCTIVSMCTIIRSTWWRFFSSDPKRHRKINVGKAPKSQDRETSGFLQPLIWRSYTLIMGVWPRLISKEKIVSSNLLTISHLLRRPISHVLKIPVPSGFSAILLCPKNPCAKEFSAQTAGKPLSTEAVRHRNFQHRWYIMSPLPRTR